MRRRWPSWGTSDPAELSHCFGRLLTDLECCAIDYALAVGNPAAVAALIDAAMPKLIYRHISLRGHG